MVHKLLSCLFCAVGKELLEIIFAFDKTGAFSFFFAIYKFTGKCYPLITAYPIGLANAKPRLISLSHNPVKQAAIHMICSLHFLFFDGLISLHAALKPLEIHNSIPCGLCLA